MLPEVPAELSLSETLTRWRAEGYVADFSIERAELRCSSCGRTHPPGAAEILDTARFEGVSDPDDEAILFALRCAHCGAAGALVNGYGPSITSEEAEVLVALHDARRG